MAATVTYNSATGTATLTPNSPLTGSTTYTATVSGAEDLAGNPMAAPVSWSFTTAASSDGTQLVIHTQPSSTATAGAAFGTQPVIYEEDQNGNLETGDNSTVVTVALESGSGPLLGTLTATVSGGVATFTNLSDNTAGTISLIFTSASSTSATSGNVVVSPAAASQLVITQQPSATATAGVVFGTQPVVTEEDAYNNVITSDNSTVVTVGLGSGSGPLQGTLTATVSAGVATFTNLADDTAETISLKFTSGSLTAAMSNNIVVSPATAKLVIHTQPSATATAGVAFAVQPVIYEEDQFGNLETGDNSTVVTVAVNGGSDPLQGTLTATMSGGVATFTTLSDDTAGTISLIFTGASLTSATSGNIVVSPAAASQLVITQQPAATATAGAAFSTQPVVTEEDAYNNVITSDNSTVVTVGLRSGSGPLQGTLTATVSAGVAKFTNLADDTAETISLKFTSGTLASATSNNIVVSPAAASKLVISQQPSATATAGVAFATQPIVKEEDAFNNVITTDSTHTVTAARGSSGTDSLKGSSLTVKFASGVATFSGLFYDKAETMNIAFSTNAGGVSAATSGNIVVSPAAASQVVISQQPSATAKAGVAFATQPIIKEEDAFNNVISSDSTHTVTAARGSTGTASLQGSSLTVTLASGVATFSGLFYDKAETMNIAFSTNASGVSSATSGNVVVSPAAASQLVISQQPSATATAGVAFATQPIIKEEDAFNNVISTDNSTVVTVSLKSGSGPLQGTTTATVSSGVATFTNVADSKAETITLKFTGAGLTSVPSNSIVVSPANTSFTIFGNTTPGTTTTSDGRAVELGVKFESSEAGYITGIRFYKGAGNTGTHVGHLWSSSGALLATATFTGETASGWQQVNFGTPVAIAANTIYVASYFAPAGHYADNYSYFASSGHTNGPLTALANSTPGGDGVYKYGASGGFPNSTYKASNYWVDVVFSVNNPDVRQTSIGTGSTAAGQQMETAGFALAPDQQEGTTQAGATSSLLDVTVAAAGPLDLRSAQNPTGQQSSPVSSGNGAAGTDQAGVASPPAVVPQGITTILGSLGTSDGDTTVTLASQTSDSVDQGGGGVENAEAQTSIVYSGNTVNYDDSALGLGNGSDRETSCRAPALGSPSGEQSSI